MMAFEDLDLYKDKPIYDLTQYYSDFVPFTVNSVYPIHRWFRFKEGYSRDLVHLILGSLEGNIIQCLDPFAGSGTTPLACQEAGVSCNSIEVNPFLHHLAKTKLGTQYTIKGFDKATEQLRSALVEAIARDYEEPIMSTITKRQGSNKWLFHRPVLQAVLGFRYCIEQLAPPYSDLFLVILASILTDVGNTFKDGKCVRYKKGWRDRELAREDVRDLFFNKTELFREDIQYIEAKKWNQSNNACLCSRGNALQELAKVAENSVDAVITSPPYLNSFDYTDVYMPELWALGFVTDYDEVRNLRAMTLRSHVQVKWEIEEGSLSDQLRELISEIGSGQESLWNDSIPNMIAGYFLDMYNTFKELKRIVRPGGHICIVIASSSYNRVIIPTDLLLADLAVDLGFSLDEIRVVRNLKRSTKQMTWNGKSLPLLRESILFFSAK